MAYLRSLILVVLVLPCATLAQIAAAHEPEPLQWGPAAAAHLMRRAGFSASPAEIERIVQQGFQATLDELLDFETVDNSAMEQGLKAKAYPLAFYSPEDELTFGDFENLNRRWLYRMIHSRHQLVEKMTLFWRASA